MWAVCWNGIEVEAANGLTRLAAVFYDKNSAWGTMRKTSGAGITLGNEVCFAE